MILQITSDPIDPSDGYGKISSERAGSVVYHYAVVKKQSGAGGETSCIEYKSCGETDEELAAIAAKIKRVGEIDDLLLIRRVGCLGIGDIISLVAASSPNSEDAFAACRQGIALLKKMTTIRKSEVYK